MNVISVCIRVSAFESSVAVFTAHVLRHFPTPGLRLGLHAVAAYAAFNKFAIDKKAYISNNCVVAKAANAATACSPTRKRGVYYT